MAGILSASTLELTEEAQGQQVQDLDITQVDDIIVHGQITDCDNDEPIVGAIVKAFEEDGTGISHTFSGCDGLYMLRIPFALAGETITITGTLTNLEPLDPCECPENEENNNDG